ncbi:TetR/AcrR family transcriptional regulator [Actinocrispum sp. NPDC049592]|uniref:TetR/AcrR family transcriptional regulator n=1 Tax=Actinocrispum sp. NPDC049592 TaxID=3154835 RepID=UPI003414188F
MASLEVIQRAAVRLFAGRGFAATGIRELSGAAGLNSATLYHYAGGKEELLASIMRACLQALLRAGQQAVAGSDDPPVQLARLVRAHVAMESANPLTSRVTDHEVRSLTGGNRTEIMAMRDAYEGLFRDVLSKGRANGDFDIADLTTTRLAIMEMCNGVHNWFNPNGRLTRAALADRFADLACRMTGARAIGRREAGRPVDVPVLPSEPGPEPEPDQAEGDRGESPAAV